ncbi:KAP family P-loop NTPase fold protein [Shimia abyssi]|uniref:KAP-like P-loop domain-containing protein n=1 Tax=Shimia abyssi TaxID=1662395 RepID=A0A2P8FDK3_9RHOB|nr:P-loop NTPase fold protein [Shimia abyssi]PSL19787.1 KAP-like P-loop domain-containing protein [Shimia abyssi]
MSDEKSVDPWVKDRLDYSAVGESFGNLIRSVDDAKVISIEAGFGRGKTFFRKAWAKQLCIEGEVVVEIDAQLSDHSGDPVVTFIGALIDALPKEDKSGRQKAFEKGKRVAGLAGRMTAGAVLRAGTGMALDTAGDYIASQASEVQSLETAVNAVEQDLSKQAGKLIGAQLAAEKVRQEELPEQLTALREALTKKGKTDRVVILIDELDRCHPDYAIALLEAMKLVFDHPGFVFCLMVNAAYLESLAAHRFGEMKSGEKYLDKFVDIRLKLPDTVEVRAAATKELFGTLPLEVPYGDAPEFSVKAAAELAEQIVLASVLSIRQIKRALLKVELAMRCYRDQPIDGPLLVFLEFRSRLSAGEAETISDFLKRSNLVPELAQVAWTEGKFGDQKFYRGRLQKLPNENQCRLLLTIPRDRFLPPDDKRYYDEYKICELLSQHYVPSHQAMLDVVARFDAVPEASAQEI